MGPQLFKIVSCTVISYIIYVCSWSLRRKVAAESTTVLYVGRLFVLRLTLAVTPSRMLAPQCHLRRLRLSNSSCSGCLNPKHSSTPTLKRTIKLGTKVSIKYVQYSTPRVMVPSAPIAGTLCSNHNAIGIGGLTLIKIYDAG